MTNYSSQYKSTQNDNVLEEKEKRKKQMEEIRKRRAIIQKNFKEKMQKYYRVNADFSY